MLEFEDSTKLDGNEGDLISGAVGPSSSELPKLQSFAFR